MKLKHSDRKETTNANVSRNAFAAAAVLTGTLAVIATAQDSTKMGWSGRALTASSSAKAASIDSLHVVDSVISASLDYLAKKDSAAPAPRIKGNFQIEKMVFGMRPVKAGDTLFIATNVCDLTDRAILKVDAVQDSGVVMTSLINSVAGPKIAGQVVATRTIAYGGEAQVGVFKAKAAKGPEPGTVVVEYTITPQTGCPESK